MSYENDTQGVKFDFRNRVVVNTLPIVDKTKTFSVIVPWKLCTPSLLFSETKKICNIHNTTITRRYGVSCKCLVLIGGT